MKIYDPRKCFQDFPELALLSSDTALCAGSFEGKGACAGKNSLIFLDFLLNFDILGDSGGSLFIKKDKKYLAVGIISTSLRAPGGFCDTKRHQIFTEVAAYHKWLMDVAIGSY